MSYFSKKKPGIDFDKAIKNPIELEGIIDLTPSTTNNVMVKWKSIGPCKFVEFKRRLQIHLEKNYGELNPNNIHPELPKPDLTQILSIRKLEKFMKKLDKFYNYAIRVNVNGNDASHDSTLLREWTILLLNFNATKYEEDNYNPHQFDKYLKDFTKKK